MVKSVTEHEAEATITDLELTQIKLLEGIIRAIEKLNNGR